MVRKSFMEICTVSRVAATFVVPRPNCNVRMFGHFLGSSTCIAPSSMLVECQINQDKATFTRDVKCVDDIHVYINIYDGFK